MAKPPVVEDTDLKHAVEVASVGLGWMVTVVLGTARHLGWLVSLQQKWPPMGKA